KGSLRNKLVFILPVLLLLSVFAPWALTPILMLGGLYLSFEGAEKIWELVRGRPEQAPAAARGAQAEDRIVSSAVSTDLILSAEIMVISMDSIDAESLWARAAVLVVVAIGITAVVYGAVGLLVKMDDVGLAMAADGGSELKERFGHGLVRAMPKVMTAISYVGMVAMLWVGGHILLAGTHDLGLAQPYGAVHHLEAAVAGIAAVGGVLAWLLTTSSSLVLGLVVGGGVAATVHILPFGHHDEEHGAAGKARAAEGAAHDAERCSRGADAAMPGPAVRRSPALLGRPAPECEGGGSVSPTEETVAPCIL